MNNDKLEVSRELLAVIETFISAQADSFPKINVPRGMRSEGLDHVSKELCALLAAPVVERQEPVGEVSDMKYNLVRFYRATGDTSKPYLLPGTKLYTAPPEHTELQGTIARLSADIDTMRNKNNELNDTIAQPQGEPIYQVMYRGDGGGGWSDVEKDSYDMKMPHPKHWRTRIVYAEQTAPVAVEPLEQRNAELLNILATAQTTLASSRWLIQRHAPGHNWLPLITRDIEAIKVAIKPEANPHWPARTAEELARFNSWLKSEQGDQQ
jgi:hypothetical protein